MMRNVAIRPAGNFIDDVALDRPELLDRVVDLEPGVIANFRSAAEARCCDGSDLREASSPTRPHDRLSSRNVHYTELHLGGKAFSS
jgi:hypothetical protein